MCLGFILDNGGDTVWSAASNWPLLGGKSSCWEGGIRGVGFVSGPYVNGTGRQGSQCNELMSIADWFPTLIERAGGTTDHLELDGYDVWKTIR